MILFLQFLQMPTVHKQVLIMLVRIVSHFTVLFQFLSPWDLSLDWPYYCFFLLLVALLAFSYDVFLKKSYQVTIPAVVVTVLLQKLVGILQLLKQKRLHKRLFSLGQFLVWVTFINLFHNQQHPFMNQLHQLKPVHPAKIIPKIPRQHSPYQLIFPLQNPSYQLLYLPYLNVFL